MKKKSVVKDIVRDIYTPPSDMNGITSILLSSAWERRKWQKQYKRLSFRERYFWWLDAMCFALLGMLRIPLILALYVVLGWVMLNVLLWLLMG